MEDGNVLVSGSSAAAVFRDAGITSAEVGASAASCNGVGELSLPRSKTVTMLDWDDTLLSSTHLFEEEKRAMASGRTYAPEGFLRQLAELEERVLGLLECARKYGDVMVITNAEAGWVELSGRQFMPRVIEYFEQHGIDVISARSRHEATFPMEPAMWKTTTFWSEVTSKYGSSDLNVVVIGDGIGERIAGQWLQFNLNNSVVKTVMLLAAPTTKQLAEELELATNYLAYFMYYERPIEVSLFRRVM